jgi:hypothetical protein
MAKLKFISLDYIIIKVAQPKEIRLDFFFNQRTGLFAVYRFGNR